MRIGELISGGIIVNYVCSSACGHCLYRSSPRRQKGYMSPETLGPCLDKVRSLGCGSMHIGGGEPMLDVDRLAAVLDCAAEHRMAIDYIETNCSWHKDPATTRATLKRLMQHGADTLMVSVDPFHNAYIPFIKVREVMDAARRVGMRLFAWKMEFMPEITQFDETKPHSLDEYRAWFGDEYIAELPERYGLSINGRVVDTFAPYLPKQSASSILERTAPCSEMWRTGHFHIDFHGNYVFTACVGMSVSCDDLREALDSQKYPYLQLLSSAGLLGLYTAAVGQHGFVARDGYVNKCDLCQHIRTHLVTTCGIRSADLQPVDFYMDH